MTQTKRILLIDDDEISNFINERKIKNAGIVEHIHVCISGMRALQMLKDIIEKEEQIPDVILLDINMPIMDGFGFLDEFIKFPLSITEKIKIVMLTSSLEKDEVRRSFEYKNVVDFFNKPLSVDKVHDLLNNNAKNG